ncbi:HPP family protein [Streptomyces solicathayae]|uniref:HPP family protein n=1 Tax=Streptomyces solicathayae TaxID=3081768 RepID=A0ABZ0LXW5_9ACTN|nr:HPP family protein [Streptomyces sp. HUAS YS2]WOX24356.1 HPP family protein [Streptomyces sp. HUAS YS2]
MTQTAEAEAPAAVVPGPAPHDHDTVHAPAPARTGWAARIARVAAAGPPRPRLRTVLAATALSTVALLCLVALGGVVHHPLLIPPLAASMALVAGAPDLPLSQPRSVIGGQLLSTLTGFAVLAIAGPGLWTAAVAGGLALGVMMLARTPHSPAAATAVIVALQDPPFRTFVGLVALACALLVTAGLIGSRLTGRRYPTYW